MTEFLGALAGRRVLLGVTGSIAAYKAPFVLRLLMKAGANVKVVLTEGAEQFITRRSFSAFGVETHAGLWDEPGELHVELARWAECILVAPTSADTMARFSVGRAADLLSATILCSSAPLFVAPAMHPTMWAAPATQENAQRLFHRGVRFIGPTEGEVASGDEGVGRMEEPERIVRALARKLAGPGPLTGRHIVVTAGPTREPIDPVRSITNRSSGKMGYAIAEVAASRGARVTLVSGPVSLPQPASVQVLPVESALDMQATLESILGSDLSGADAVIMTAAIADYRVAMPSDEKIKRAYGPISLELTPNPDILADIGRRRSALRPVLVGFALETATGDALISLGRRKLIDKRVDLIVANSVSDVLEKDDSRAMLVTPVDCTPLEPMQKVRVAARILDWVTARLGEPERLERTE